MNTSSSIYDTSLRGTDNCGAIISYKKYGVNKNTIRYFSEQQFVIPEMFSDCFQTYYLLKWSKEWFLNESRAGIITRNGTRYNVIYNRCTRGAILAAPARSQITLSFRQAQKEYGLDAYVLVSYTDKLPVDDTNT